MKNPLVCAYFYLTEVVQLCGGFTDKAAHFFTFMGKLGNIKIVLDEPYDRL